MATKDKEKELPAEETKTSMEETKTSMEEIKTSTEETKPSERDILKMQVLVAVKKDDEIKTVELSHIGYQNMLEDIERCKESPDRLTSNWKGYRLASEEEVAEFVKENEVQTQTKTEFANKYLA